MNQDPSKIRNIAIIAHVYPMRQLEVFSLALLESIQIRPERTAPALSSAKGQE